MEMRTRAVSCFFTALLLVLFSSCSPNQGENLQAYLKEAGLTIPPNAQVKTQVCDYLSAGRSLAVLLSISDRTVPSFIATNNLFKIQNSDYDITAFPFSISSLISRTEASHWSISSFKTVSGYVIMSPDGSGKTDVSMRFLLPERSR